MLYSALKPVGLPRLQVMYADTRLSPTPNIVDRGTVETMRISLITILQDGISDPGSNISDPYYPFGKIYSDANWIHGTVSANPNYIWGPADQ